MSDPDVTFRAATAADLKAKIAAYIVLFGVEPEVRIEGDVRGTDRHLAFLRSGRARVIAIGNKRVTIRLAEEGDFQMDVATNAEEARYTLMGRR